MWVRFQLQSLKTSDFAPASRKEFLDLQATIECGVTPKRVRNMIRTYNYNNNISKYNPLPGSSSIKLPKEVDHLRKGLINIQNIDDNEFFKWCLARYLHPADHHPTRITKANKDFSKRLEFREIFSHFQSELETFTKLKKIILLST